MVMIE